MTFLFQSRIGLLFGLAAVFSFAPACMTEADPAPGSEGRASRDEAENALETQPGGCDEKSTSISSGGSTEAKSGGDAPSGGGTTTSTQGSGGAPSGGAKEAKSAQDPEQLCVDTINQYRATLGLAPLERWLDKETCADDQCKKDSTAGRAHSAFGQCGEFAQNVCPGWSGPPDKMLPTCLKMMWDEGPGAPSEGHGHYVNMSNPKYTKVSCGFYMTPNGKVWAAQNFR